MWMKEGREPYSFEAEKIVDNCQYLKTKACLVQSKLYKVDKKKIRRNQK